MCLRVGGVRSLGIKDVAYLCVAETSLSVRLRGS